MDVIRIYNRFRIPYGLSLFGRFSDYFCKLVLHGHLPDCELVDRNIAMGIFCHIYSESTYSIVSQAVFDGRDLPDVLKSVQIAGIGQPVICADIPISDGVEPRVVDGYGCSICPSNQQPKSVFINSHITICIIFCYRIICNVTKNIGSK